MKTSHYSSAFQSYRFLPIPLGCLLMAALAIFAIRQGQRGTASVLENGKSRQVATPTEMLQFTSNGHALGFHANGLYVAGASHALHVEFVNARETKPLSDAVARASESATPLSAVRYPNLWEGVSLIYDAPAGAILRSTYRLEPYAKADIICLRYNTPVSVQANGSAQIGFKTGILNESRPLAWQEHDGKRVPVKIAFSARGENKLGFSVGDYDRSQPLYIDPTLTWNTFLGGSSLSIALSLAVDAAGNVYVGGNSDASWGSPVSPFSGGFADAFVAKLDTNGNLIWNTFLGGSEYDTTAGTMAVDPSGNVYVAGNSDATWGSPVRAHDGSGAPDAFAAKLDSNGNLIWNTFLGGFSNDYGGGLARDTTGNLYVTGYSDVYGWGSPVQGPNGGIDVFAAKLDPNGNLIWNTFLGSSAYDVGSAIGVDAAGNAVIGGTSNATWGAPVRAFSGLVDAFAAKLDPSGNLIWNTFLGSSASDSCNAIAVDVLGNIYAAGASSASWGSPVRPFTGFEDDAFAAKLDSNGNLVWNTFLGGYDATAEQGSDLAFAITVDPSGNAYVAGQSNVTWGSPDAPYSGGTDGFAAKLDTNGNLTWNAFLGGSGFDVAFGLAPDATGNVYVAGYSDTSWGSPVHSLGNINAFVAKLGAAVPLAPDLQVTNITTTNNQAPQGSKVTITATVSNTGTGAAGASTTMFRDNTIVIGSVSTPAIPAGGSANVSVDWRTAGVKGNRTINVTADAMNAVAESNEGNNTSQKTVYVQGNQVR